MRSIQLLKLRPWSIAVLLAGLGLTSMTPAQGQTGEQTVSDATIAAAVEREFFRDSAIARRQAELTVHDGIVMLEGEVETLAARRQSEEIAGIVRGVRSVINRLRIAPTTKTPDIVQRDVEAALRSNPVAESRQINANTGLGNEVELTGRVESWAERDLIERLVMTVPGVMSVTNNLDFVQSAAPRGEAEIAEEIAARLRWDVRVDDSLVNVLVLDGSRVVLSGTVGSLAEKQHAERLAQVAGVSDVLATQLSVEPWAKNEELRRANARTSVTDAEISAAVETSLRYDPRVAAETVAVTTRDGNVVLEGEVTSLLARHAAVNDAQNTYGVDSVSDEIVVSGGLRDDATIQRLITNAMRGYGLLDDNEVSVEVDDGRVWLTGDATSAYAHWQLEEIAGSVQGVLEVNSELTINGRAPTFLARIYAFDPQPDQLVSISNDELKTDREIYAGVESELFWSPFVDSDGIDIAVDDGVVTLTGNVDSAREYAAARENAFEGGALIVNNKLSVAN
jgi:osmotically-inducible protein OsmY